MFATQGFSTPIHTIIRGFKYFIYTLKVNNVVRVYRPEVRQTQCLARSLIDYKGAQPHLAHALDILSTPVMLTDTRFVITYANASCRLWMKTHGLRAPFGSEHLVGVTFDRLRDAHPHLGCTITFLRNPRGEFAGAFIDWGTCPSPSPMSPHKGVPYGIHRHA